MISTGLKLVVDTFSPVKFYRKHKCLVIAMGIIVLFVAILAVSYNAPPVTVTPKVAKISDVIAWSHENVKCSAGTASHLEPANVADAANPGQNTTVFNYNCTTTKVAGKAFFTMFVLLVCLVLMVQNYPADLVMLGGTIIFFITGVLPGERGACLLRSGAAGCLGAGAGAETSVTPPIFSVGSWFSKSPLRFVFVAPSPRLRARCCCSV